MARVLITGSSDGLGLMAGQLLARDGHEVTLHARNEARAGDARAALPEAAHVVVGDLASESFHHALGCAHQRFGFVAVEAGGADFRLKLLNAVAGGGSTAGALLTAGISKSISYYDPDTLVSYSGPLWELDPVEIRPRTKPATTAFSLDPIEQGVFTSTGVDLNGFRTWLQARDLALIVSDYAYHSLVRRHPSLLGPETFEAIRFQVKSTRARAWTYLPDASL